MLKAGEPDALEMLVKDCGELLLTEPLWKCFMSKSPPASSAERISNNNDRVANDIKNRCQPVEPPLLCPRYFHRL